MQCRSPTNFLRWREWSVQFERRSAVPGKLRRLITNATEPSVLPWTEFEQSVTEATQLARPATFDHLELIEEQYSTLRRYTPEFLDVLKLKAAPAAQAVLDAINVVREMNTTGARKVPEGANITFVKARWNTPIEKTGSRPVSRPHSCRAALLRQLERLSRVIAPAS
jgi:hypothetical protein